MRAVWKFPIVLARTPFGVVDPMLPRGAKLLSVQMQDGRPVLWALVDTEAQPEPRTLHVFGTGHAIPPRHEYVGTWQNPPLVWHLFEERAS